MNDKKIKYAELHLPYWKQGCDIQHYVDQADGKVDVALENFAQSWENLAASLRDLKEAIGSRASEIKIYGDTHFIQVTGPTDLIEELIAKDLLDRDMSEEDEEEFMEDFEEEDDEDEQEIEVKDI